MLLLSHIINQKYIGMPRYIQIEYVRRSQPMSLGSFVHVRGHYQLCSQLTETVKDRTTYVDIAVRDLVCSSTSDRLPGMIVPTRYIRYFRTI